jgi:DNA repair protein RadC
MKKISEIPKLERPREKLRGKGPKALTDVELLAILLGNGTKRNDVMIVAGNILKVIDRCNDKIQHDELQKIEGVGPVKAGILTAALEFARRRIRPEGVKITYPTDVLPLLSHMNDRKQEHFVCISLSGANEVIASRIVSVGLVNRTQVHPREVFADPITDRASAIIVAHNHPAGSLVPSKDDIAVTMQLKEAGKTLGISLLDHIIFNHKGYYSFLEHKVL